jgi:hypothetical protein
MQSDSAESWFISILVYLLDLLSVIPLQIKDTLFCLLKIALLHSFSHVTMHKCSLLKEVNLGKAVLSRRGPSELYLAQYLL